MKPNRSQLVLGGLCLALIVAIVAIEMVPDPKPLASSPGDEPAPENRPVVTSASEQALSDLKARPPFWPERRVPVPVVTPVAVIAPPPPAPPPPPLPPSSELTLVGIVNGPDGRIAILRLKSTGKLERHTEGDAIDRWAVKTILVDRVVFVGGGSETELLFPPPGERKSGQPAAPGAPRSPFQPLPMPPVPPRR